MIGMLHAQLSTRRPCSGCCMAARIKSWHGLQCRLHACKPCQEGSGLRLTVSMAAWRGTNRLLAAAGA